MRRGFLTDLLHQKYANRIYIHILNKTRAKKAEEEAAAKKAAEDAAAAE